MKRLIVIIFFLVGVGADLTVVAASAPSASRTPNGRAAVKVFAPRGGPGPSCARVYPLRRTVSTPAVLTGAMRALLAGPSAAELRAGYGGWFSARTANKLRSVQVRRSVAYVDLRDFSRLIPNASSSCGRELHRRPVELGEQQGAPTVRRAVYSFNGSRRGLLRVAAARRAGGQAISGWAPCMHTETDQEEAEAWLESVLATPSEVYEGAFD